MNEIWRTSKTNHNYEVSNFGNIRSKDRWVENPGNPNRGYYQKGKTLRVCKARNGYSVVNLGRNKTQYIHRLVCEAFIGEIPKGMTVNHKNGNKSDNRAENLEIMTYRENHLHAFHELNRRPTCLGKTNTNASKPISQFKDGKLIATYPSAREATRQTGVSFKGISACCHGKAKTAGGYGWAMETSADTPKGETSTTK